MRAAGILHGDLIVARATSTARDGEIVVARLGDDVTVKRLHIRGRTALLLPENPKFDPIKFDEETAVVGIVVGLIRDVTQRRGSRGSSWAQ